MCVWILSPIYTIDLNVMHSFKLIVMYFKAAFDYLCNDFYKLNIEILNKMINFDIIFCNKFLLIIVLFNHLQL